jgi:hypothetical protein
MNIVLKNLKEKYYYIKDMYENIPTFRVLVVFILIMLGINLLKAIGIFPINQDQSRGIYNNRQSTENHSKAYKALKAQGLSDSEAKQAEKAVENLCTLSGEKDCY